MKALKTIFALGLVVCLVVIGCSAVLGDTDVAYGFTISTPYAGSLRHTGFQRVESGNGANAYVTKSGSTAETEYVLFHSRNGSTVDFIQDYMATWAFHKLTKSGKYSFTYLDSYGGNGTQYYMCVYPSNSDFQTYYTSGRWNT